MKLLALRGLCEGAVAKIWKVEEKSAGDKKWKVLQISVSESAPDPNDKTKYVNKVTFSGFVNYNGPMKAETLNNATVVLRGISVSTSKGKDEKYFTNFAVSDLILMKKGEANGEAAPEAAQATATPDVADAPVGDLGDDEFPF